MASTLDDGLFSTPKNSLMVFCWDHGIITQDSAVLVISNQGIKCISVQAAPNSLENSSSPPSLTWSKKQVQSTGKESKSSIIPSVGLYHSSILVSSRLECLIRVHGHRLVLLSLSIFSMDVSAPLLRLWEKLSPIVFKKPRCTISSLRIDSEICMQEVYGECTPDLHL